jgi:hypothetical protein
MPNDYDPFGPWNTPGWTAANGYPLVVSDNGIYTPEVVWPVGLVLVNIVGTFLDHDGLPVNGVVRFTNHQQYRFNDTLINPGQVVGVVREGALEVELPASNDPLYDNPFVYDVKECWPGGRKYRIIVPYDAVTDPELYELETDETDETIAVDESTTLRVTQGATYEKTFGYFNSNGTPVTGITGYTAHFVIRESVGGTIIYDEDIAFNDVTAVATFSLTSIETAALDVGRFVYGLELVSPDVVPIVIPLVTNGAFLVSASVA